MKIFVFSPKSTKASEKAKKPGDNATFVILKYLKKYGVEVVGTEVAFVPGDKPISLQRRTKAIENHKHSDLTLIMGSDTERALKSWFPVNESLVVPQPFFYVNDPGRIEIELLVKIRENCKTNYSVAYFDSELKTIGGAL